MSSVTSTLQNTAKAVTGSVTSLINHLPPGVPELVEGYIVADLLSRTDAPKKVDALVGSLSPQLYAVLAQAVDNHRDKLK